jgi:hypothetical protein
MMEDKVIKMGLDLSDEIPFSPQEIQQYTITGKLVIGFTGIRTISNAQIDLLFPAFQRTSIDNTTSAKAVSAKHGKNKRDYKADFGDDEMQQIPEVKAIAQIRGSLNNLLLELDKVDHLSDRELVDKVR